TWLPGCAGGGGSSHPQSIRRIDTRPAWPGALPVSRPHRIALPDLWDDHQLFLVRARQSFGQLVGPTIWLGAGDDPHHDFLAGAIYGGQRQASLATDCLNPGAALASGNDGACGIGVGVENLDPPARDRWLAIGLGPV